jgi:catechol 2,3-dioxygenase-like lactoylglutathione lyase family enzyme
MFGIRPFWIADDCAVDVRNLSSARSWYEKMLDLREWKTDRDDDSGRPFADLGRSRNGPFLTILELEPGAAAAKSHTIFYAANLQKCQDWLVKRGLQVEPITSDSGGNRFFRFRDLDGNPIEVCVEP